MDPGRRPGGGGRSLGAPREYHSTRVSLLIRLDLRNGFIWAINDYTGGKELGQDRV